MKCVIAALISFTFPIRSPSQRRNGGSLLRARREGATGAGSRTLHERGHADEYAFSRLTLRTCKGNSTKVSSDIVLYYLNANKFEKLF